MPRGVAIPELRQQLFTAAERVIARDGPGKLTGRAVAVEAKVAAGLLYAHFTDFDDFLAAYAVDRSFTVAAAAATLPDLAGTGDATANLCDAALAIPREALAALAQLLVLRPGLTGLVQAVLGDRASGLDAIEQAATAYLEAERRSGRLAETADPPAIALAFVGVLHHLILTGAEDLSDRLRGAVTALVGANASERSGDNA